MVDISVPSDVFDLALFAFLMGWPGIVAGVVFSLLAWPRHRLLGCGLGALIGGALGVAGFFA